MAYSAIEQRYVDLLITAAFPDAVSETKLIAEEPSLDGVQLAAGPSATRTDAGPRLGRGGVTKAQSEAAGGLERPLTGLADVAAGVARGGFVQAAGLGGDLEMFYNGLKSVFNRPEDQSRIDAFLAGMAVKTGMATSEQVSKEGFRIPLTDIQVKLPPVVPEGAADAKSRQAAADVGQAFGELAPLPGAIDAGIAGTKTIAKGAKELAPKVGELAEDYLRRTGGLMDVAPPRVDSIDKFPIGPGSIKPRVIAQDKPLHREMSADNLMDFLRNDKQFAYAPVFVTDNADLAIGQGSNAGVKVRFRANSVSGKEHRKPMTGDTAGREYQADVFAPMAIESIIFASEADLKKVKSVAARVLQTDFERVTDGKKNIVFVRKVQGEEKK